MAEPKDGAVRCRRRRLGGTGQTNPGGRGGGSTPLRGGSGETRRRTSSRRAPLRSPYRSPQRHQEPGEHPGEDGPEWQGRLEEAAGPGPPPPLSFTNFDRELEDLGRFRIVTNFLSDVELIARRLAAPYGGRADLSAAQHAVAKDYLLRHNAFTDKILIDPNHRHKGERCHKGVFEPRLPELSHLRVEVQIQTLLQEAWDKKDHYLLYEPRRQGQEPSLEHECEMFAMSELLYVADLTFDRLREAMLKVPPGGKKKGGSDASS